MNQSDLRTLRKSLEQLRGELERDLCSILPAQAGGSDLVPENREVLVRQLEDDIAAVDAAFERIDTGLYGYCIGCGEEIEMNQLRADPATSLCLSCHSRVKRRSKLI
ncbi:TraR/DksA family transcriptional regulator [Marinobacterium litorale]|uniref:TraR/DksA family transcriptional regulator n=1 Tax=Marinobacterium litorale TaxID=404770 RepID=UPI000424ED14|nr:TraR/DksA C4-type zinc finger protein [Marinobacterium litorale]